MADWPEHDSWAWETAGLSGTNGTTVTAGSLNTKGSYAQLVAATTYDATGLLVSIMDNSARAQYLIDVAIGASGSEQVIVPDIMLGPAYATFPQAQMLYVPVAVPAGSRIAARSQADSASATVTAVVHLVRGGWAGAGREGGPVTAYGVNAAESTGTTIDPGGTANAKGSWTQIAAATARPVRWLLLLLHNRKNNADTAARFLFDIAIGAAAAEQVIVPDVPFVKNQNTDSPGAIIFGPWPVGIPEGTRLAMRGQCSIIDATDRLSDAILYGVG